MPAARGMTRIGLLVNPDAGIGGRLGLKGSDGQAEYARSQGAEDRAGPRVRDALVHFTRLRKDTSDLQWVTSEGRMGSEWIGSEIGVISTVHQSSGLTSAEDTAGLVQTLLDAEIDLLVYGGGDGTTRDIVAALEKAGRGSLPLIGVPCGVKMYSGCFAASPKAAAEVLSAWLDGELLVANTEVLDLDEKIFREGRWVVRMYAEAMTPASPRWMQGTKQRVEASGEEEIVEGLADHISEILMFHLHLIIWGSGGTLRTIGEMVRMNPTALGIDASIGSKQIGTDLNESDLLKLLSEHEGEVTILLSPMGGQGFLIGRGNLQISPEVLRTAGIDSVLGICTPAKLLTVRRLRIETGDSDLDAEFAGKRYMKVLQGYRTTRVLPVSVD